MKNDRFESSRIVVVMTEERSELSEVPRRAAYLAVAYCVCLVIAPNPVFAVDVWLTTGDKSSLLAQQQDLIFQPGSGSGGHTDRRDTEHDVSNHRRVRRFANRLVCLAD